MRKPALPQVAFKFGLDQSDELYDSKLSLWIRDGAEVKLVRLAAAENENSALALSCLRVAAANRQEFYGLAALGGVGGRGQPHLVRDVAFPLGLRNERAALMLLAAQVKRVYETALAKQGLASAAAR